MFRRLALIAVAALGLTFTLAACQNEGSPISGTTSVQPDAPKGACTTPPGTANTGC